ncbi:MAG TPA: NAD(P)H-quinone oxidoreductase [Deltaproteobacteria bacterium]|nr:NAD(P)H-quinone oxidoreductase [Deltaproteobacteria bacterium]
MHAIVVGSDRQLTWSEVPTPDPGPHEVRITVAAAGVNRADLLQRAGLYPPPPGASELLGLECSGTIDEVGERVSDLAPGDPVCALLAGGGYAESVVCPAGCVLPIPEGLSVVEAAALPEVFATAWMVLCSEGQLQPGEAVLIHAAASGVGTASLQLATVLGARSFATAGGSEKLQRCVELGASGTHDRHEGPWRDAVAQWSPNGVDVILDPVGGDYITDDQRVLAIGGRLVVIGLLGGRDAGLDLGRLLVKRQRIVGTTLRSRSAEDKARILTQLQRELWPRFTDGTVRPIIDQVLPIQEAEQAHALLQGNATVGKILLEVGSS